MRKKKRTPKSPFPIIHGAYCPDRVARETQYLWAVRRRLLHDLSPEGPAHLSEARNLIIERLLAKLSVVHILEKYLADNPPELLKAGASTGLWLSTGNAILKDLLALGLDRRSMEMPILSPQELLAAAGQDVAEEEARASKDAVVVTSEAARDALEAEDGGEHDKTPGA